MRAKSPIMESEGASNRAAPHSKTLTRLPDAFIPPLASNHDRP